MQCAESFFAYHCSTTSSSCCCTTSQATATVSIYSVSCQQYNGHALGFGSCGVCGKLVFLRCPGQWGRKTASKRFATCWRLSARGILLMGSVMALSLRMSTWPTTSSALSVLVIPKLKLFDSWDSSQFQFSTRQI